jgi:fructokinase
MYDKSSRPSVYGTGLLALDLVIKAEESQPIRAWAGGTCGNVLTILGFLGWESYPIARLNGDVASMRVKSDLQKWGIHLDFAECNPTSSTPIIVQRIHRDKNGVPKHKFTWSCPHCGHWLPGYKPVTIKNTSWILPKIGKPNVFFMDRLSRAALLLAAHAAEKGAIIFFEPSSKMNLNLLTEALQIAHIVKYAEQRFSGFDDVRCKTNGYRLEIQTLGQNGLRYRSSLPKANSKDWTHIAAVPAPLVADTCGAGDWCTAGLISMIGTSGYKGLQQLKKDALQSALHFGQVLAAWACGFEGARGGMYSVDKKTFDMQIKKTMKGEHVKGCKPIEQIYNSTLKASIICPACSSY